MIGSIILLIVLFWGIIKSNINIIFYVLIISIFNDLFLIPFGFALPIHNIISLFFLPKLINKRIFKFIKNSKSGTIFLYFELLYTIIITILFGIIFPWKSQIDYQRSWNQISEFKAIIQIFRLIADFSIFMLIFYWLSTKKIYLDTIEKAITNVIIVTVLIAIIDFFLNFALKNFLFSNYDRSEDLIGRFTSFCGEPRVFGKSCLFAFNYFLFLSKKKNYFPKIITSLGVILSLSASTFILYIFSIFIFAILKKKFTIILIFLIFSFLMSTFLLTNDFFMDNTYKKIEVVLSGNIDALDDDKVTENEPQLFTRFEVFDRAALNFMYNNSFYFIFGTGSNLISIPASPYLSSIAYSIYGDRIDSAPHTFIVNLISRSGLVGLFLWSLFYVKLIFFNKRFTKNYTHFFIFLFIANLISFNIIFYLYLGLILYIKFNYKNIFN